MVEVFSINMPILALVSDMRDAYQIYLHFLGDNINPRPLTERGFLYHQAAKSRFYLSARLLFTSIPAFWQYFRIFALTSSRLSMTS